MGKLKLEPTFDCAQQLLMQAILGALTKNASLLDSVLKRAVEAKIIEIVEEDDGDEVNTTIRIPDGTNEEVR